MRTFLNIALVVGIALALGACATKRYDRAQRVTGTERAYYTCKDIEIELSKIAEMRRQIAEGSEINAASVGAFLADFGIGNAMEKSEAEKTIAQRETDLLALRAEKNCIGGSSVEAAGR